MSSPIRVDYDELDFDYSPDGVRCFWHEQPFTGIGVELYPDGSPHAESVFHNGIDTQVGMLWYPTGQTQRRTEADEVKQQLQVTEWHENGVLKSHTTYEHGVKIAEQRWDDKGAQLTDFRISEHDEYYNTLLLHRAKSGSSA